MKIVLSIDISPKLLGTFKEEDFRKKLESRCLTLLKSYEKKWSEENLDLLTAKGNVDDAEVDWAEMVGEGFEDAKKSIVARVWGNT